MTPRGKAGRGFSLVEALVAVAVLGVALALLAPSLGFFARVNGQQEERSGAVRVAEQTFEALRAAPFGARVGSGGPWPDAPGSEVTRTVDTGLGSFSIVYSYCQGGDGCLTTDTARHLRARVRAGGRVVYELETVIAEFDRSG